MSNKNSKLAMGIAILFEIIFISTMILKIVSKQWTNFSLLPTVIICTTLPFIITYISNKKKILLPSSFQLITLIFIILTLYFGEFMKFYTMFWWWDLFLHAAFGSYAVITALHLTQGVIIKGKEVTKKRFTIFTVTFAFCFSITLGTLWEIFEFLGDYFFNANMVNGGLEDTSTDLIVKVLAAFITGIICYLLKLKNQI